MRIYGLGMLFLMGCTKPDLTVDTNGEGAAEGSDPLDTDSSDDGGIVDTSDSSTGGNDTAVAEAGDGSGGDEGSDDGGGDTGEGPEMVADFSLEDLNPESPRFGEMISPRDYIEEVSGWYFIKGS